MDSDESLASETTTNRTTQTGRRWFFLRWLAAIGFMSGKPYTPERAYRLSVLPFGIYLIVGGIVGPIAALLVPPEVIHLPPFSDPWLKRAIFFGATLPYLPLGVGFCLRSKLAWWGFFAWQLMSVCFAVVVGILDRQDPDRFAEVVIGPIFNLGFAVGLYFATKPVFVVVSRRQECRQDQVQDDHRP